MEKYFSTFNKDGVRTGTFTRSIHGNNIPKNAMEISKADWEKYCTNNFILDKATSKPKRVVVEPTKEKEVVQVSLEERLQRIEKILEII